MRLGRNVAAAVAGSAWAALLGLAVVPLYLRHLGVEAFGVIGFFSTLQVLLQVLDLGLTPTVNREVARRCAAGEAPRAGPLLHSLASVYWAVALLLGLGLAAAAPAIAGGWLQAGRLAPGTLTASVALMGLIVACRWPAGLYLGALMGAERQVLASGLGMLNATLSSLGAVAVLALVSPTLEAFFLWQALVGLAHALAARWAAWRAVGRAPGLRFSRDELRRVWRFSAGMSGIAVLAVVFTQLDKVILSRLLPLEELGRYMLATTVSAALYVVINPVFNVLYPRFSALVARGEEARLAGLYRDATRALGAVVFPLGTLLLLFGRDLVAVWTGDAALAAEVAPVLGLLAMGSSLHGVMYLPYALQLAHGRPRIALQINLALSLVLVPLVVALATTRGALGGALAWLVLHVLYVLLGTWRTHRELLRGTGPTWLVREVGVPLGVSLLVGLAGQLLLRGLAWPAPGRLACGAALAALSSLLVLAASPALRAALAAAGWRGRGGPA